MTWIRGITLTISEWLLITAATVIGGLIVALRLQGSKLHRTQVGLVAAQAYNAHYKTQEAVDRYKKALEAYKKAGGVLLLLLCLSLPSQAPAVDSTTLPACQLALTACNNVVEAQGQEIDMLRKNVTVEQPPSLLQSIPWPIWMVLGGVTVVMIQRASK